MKMKLKTKNENRKWIPAFENDTKQLRLMKWKPKMKAILCFPNFLHHKINFSHSCELECCNQVPLNQYILSLFLAWDRQIALVKLEMWNANRLIEFKIVGTHTLVAFVYGKKFVYVENEVSIAPEINR